MLTSLKRSPLVELATDQLRASILAGTWQVGERLPSERPLSEQLGVGRSTVREAVRALVHAGLLETRQGSGTYVVSLSEQDGWEPALRRARLLDVYEVRAALELQAAALAATRRTAEDLRALDAAWQRRERTLRAARDSAFVEADVGFHAAVVAAAHNPLLAELFAGFRRVLADGLAAVVADEALTGIDSSEDHRALLEAIRAGDPDGARTAAGRLIDGASAAIRALGG